MARSVKVDELSTSKAIFSVALQVGYKQLRHKQNEAVNFSAGHLSESPRGSGFQHKSRNKITYHNHSAI